MADENSTNNPDTTRTASDRIEKGAERFKHATSSAVGSTHEAVDHAADKVEHGMHRGTDKVASAAAYATEHASDWMDNVREYVRDKPAQSLVIAVAAGWLVGRLMHRR